MRDVPFYENRTDNNSCMLAVYRSVLEFFSAQKWTWEELEELTGYKDNTVAWTIKALVSLAKDGWNIRTVEPFDYTKYLRIGVGYLDEVFNNDEAKWQLENTNIRSIQKYIPEFLRVIHHEVRRPALKDIDTMLEEGRLVTVVLNSQILNKMAGYSAHNILIIEKSDHDYIFHDPGLPGVPYRKEAKSLIQKAMGNASDVVGFRK